MSQDNNEIYKCIIMRKWSLLFCNNKIVSHYREKVAVK